MHKPRFYTPLFCGWFMTFGVCVYSEIMQKFFDVLSFFRALYFNHSESFCIDEVFRLSKAMRNESDILTF